MRKNELLYYKSFDGNNLSEIDRKLNECFNEYGYNMESTKRRTIPLDEVACKTGPYCRNMCKKKEKR